MKRQEELYFNPDGAVIEGNSQLVEVNYKDVHHFEADGTPVFKKHIKERTILTKRSSGDKVLFAIVFAIFLIHSITLFIPILWVLKSSVVSLDQFNSGVSTFALPLPEYGGWCFHNYIDAFTQITSGETGYFGMILNSIWYTFACTALDCFLPSMTAYVLSKYKFKGNNVIYTIVIASLTIPVIGTTAAAIRFFATIGVYNTFWFPIVSCLGGGFTSCFLVYYGFFKSVSNAYREAASIDGAGHYTIFFRIMLPQALPIVFTYAITLSISRWNDYMTILLYMKDFPTLASGLYEYQLANETTGNWPIFFAAVILSAIPPVIIFSVFSNKIMTSISVGGLKG